MRNCQLDVVEKLIKKKANVNFKDANGQTPLHLALEHGHKDVAEKLIRGGANVNLKDNNNQTPAETAAKSNGYINMAGGMLKGGATTAYNIFAPPQVKGAVAVTKGLYDAYNNNATIVEAVRSSAMAG
ncbi:26S proteasome non-ATPase regulatory subunit 10-like [Sitodiplosis mosellana]|uniref:26S proteasome non-ATPase regulatory subunit 10-like n=1 Tax=Sitodiplosis mosellana TaxID=263140 RepID=UPI002443FC95|nr:26S proteasome non-ATPase regulatory subunit 10-like [Sitodiplosis mosellana]